VNLKGEETGERKGESKTVRGLRETAHQFGMFLRGVDSSMASSTLDGRSPPKGVRREKRDENNGKGLKSNCVNGQR